MGYDPNEPRDKGGKWSNASGHNAGGGNRDIAKQIADQHSSQAGKVNINQRTGIGSVPYNQDVDYRGFVTHMTPRQFLNLAAPLFDDEKTETKKYLKEEIKKGTPIGSPFLQVDFSNEKRPAVKGHEGRTRMTAINELYPDQEIPVHIFPRGKRAKDITDKMIQTFKAVADSESDQLTFGPHFSKYTKK